MQGYNKRIIASLLIFLSIVILCYLVFERGMIKYYEASYQKFDEMFDKNEYYDVLLLGSSRTHRNIDTHICDSLSQFTFYNAGISGAGGYEMLTALNGFLFVHPRPKVVILNIDIGIVNIDRVFFNPNFYLPSLNNDAVYSSLKRKEYPVFMLKYLPPSRFIEYNDDVRIDAIRGLIGKKETPFKQYKGYLAMYENVGKFDTVFLKKEQLALVKENFKYLDSVVDICASKGIKLVFITSPVYKRFYVNKYSDYPNFINHIKNNYKVPILFFDNSELNFNRKYFSDNIHLNKLGSELFSKDLVKSLGVNILKNDTIIHSN